MLRLIESDKSTLWDSIVRSFPNWDVYYLCGYARSLEAHEKGRAFLISFSFGMERLCYPVMEKDVADSPEFQGLLPSNTWFDWETPYGYGGPCRREIYLKRPSGHSWRSLQRFAGRDGWSPSFCAFIRCCKTRLYWAARFSIKLSRTRFLWTSLTKRTYSSS